jgi:predicted dehydrogenase
LWALAPHDVSLALHLYGELPSVVSAEGDAWGRAAEDNAATALLQFSSGRTARIHVERHAPAKRRDMIVAGTQATLTFDELAPTDQALRLATAQRASVVVPVEARDALLAQCRGFVTAAARGDAAGGDGAHAVDVVRVLEAGERSMRQQGAAQAIVTIADPASSFEAA